MSLLQIDGHTIHPGESTKLSINIARLPSHTDIDLVIHVNRSEIPGPIVLLSGGLHGDEINGIEIVRRIMERNINQPLKGTIISMPIINIYGFINFSRYVPDGKDINRSFPGNRNGSLASRVAHFMTSTMLPVVDYGLDFHTGGANRSNFPQVRCTFRDEQAVALAQATNAPFILHSPLIKKSLRDSAYRKGKSFLVYEGGESMRMDEIAIEEGIKCAMNFLSHLEMIPATHAEPSSIWIKESAWIRSRYSGIFHSDVELGQIVGRGEEIGQITDPFGDFQKVIKSPGDGYVIGLNNTPIVHQGDALVHLGKD